VAEAPPAIAEYLDFLRHEKKYSPNTIKASQRDLSRFAAHCGKAGIDITRADEHAVRAYAMALHRGGLTPSSVQRHLSSLRSFFRHQLRLAARAPIPPSSCAGRACGARCRA